MSNNNAAKRSRLIRVFQGLVVAAIVAGAASSANALVISDFRVRGPNGANDEYIRITNETASDFTIAGGGTGYAIAASNGVARCVIPNGTVIPAGGSFLCANSVGYSLASNATPDATYTTDIPDNAGIALFNTSVAVDFTLANRLDAVGSTSEANTLYKEGTGYPSLTPFSIDYAFTRDRCGKGGSITTLGSCSQAGAPKDTNNNASDFVFVDTNGTSAGAGQRLGAPGPANLASPIPNGNNIPSTELDTCSVYNAAPNTILDLTSDPANNSTFGTLDVRRTFTNNTGGSLTALRFRVVDLTTFPAPSGYADLRPRTSSDVVVTVDRAPCGSGTSNITVHGTTLTQPPSQPNGGGFNSTFTVPSVSIATPLANGASIDLRFLFGRQQTGVAKFAIIAEGLPSAGGIYEFLDCYGSSICGPSVSSIVRAGTSPTNASTVSFTVTFNASVTGVDTSDFQVATTGGVSGASVMSVSGSGTTYTVIVNRGSGTGTVGLNLVDDDSIKDGSNNPLGGTGAGNGNFTGETYTTFDVADLSITKTDGVTTATPGGSVTYTITASNGSGVAATGATVADTFPAVLTATWTCVGAGGGTCTASGSGNINDTVNLPAGASVTYTASATISPSATGTLSNTATVTLAGDPNAANNSATDTDTLTPSANLGITKTDGVTTVTAGGSTTYTITASNAGPSNATGATVADTFPASLTGTWTCVGAGGGTCTASGSGNINNTVNLPAGGSVTYTVSTTISPSATGTLSNTATVAAPGGVTDPTPGNNSATDSDTIGASADLSITKTDGVTTATPGGSVTYTITASNAGPSNASGATVADTFPASLTGTWTCVGAGGGTCTASGSGNINDTVNLPAGGSVTYTASATISAVASGTLSNTATVAAPGGVTDPTPGNNSATDSDTLSPSANLGVTVTDGVTSAAAGGSVTYTITASNSGPSNASGATVADTFPASLTVTWTCVGAGGGTCTASGSGNINDTVNLPSGGSVTYTASAALSASATGSLSNTATVAAPGGVDDPFLGNNSATDTDTISANVDLSITKTDGVTTAQAGTSVTYTITASNSGPANAPGATVTDTLPAGLTATWTCVGAGGGTCTASGSGSINDMVNLPAGGSVTYTVIASISPLSTGTLSNTATVAAPGGVTDVNPGNNSATDTDTLTPAAPVPTLSEWAMALLIALIGGGGLLLARRRRTV